VLSLDIDYAENLAIEEARLLQSEHWSTNACTLFMGIFQWLSVEQWNDTECRVPVGAHVTAFGEKRQRDPTPHIYSTAIPLISRSSYFSDWAAGVDNRLNNTT